MAGFVGVFWAKRLHFDVVGGFFTVAIVVLELDSIVDNTGRLLLGVHSSPPVTPMSAVSSAGGIPICRGAEDPVNHDARPFDLSANLITPSLSPDNVGINSSISCFGLFRSGLLELVLVGDRKSDNAVKDR